MIIKFSNLGAIKETELDLRPLTIIIGPNNSNKTYIAYSTYGLWKHARGFVPFNSMPEGRSVGEDTLALTVDDAYLKTYLEAFDTHLKAFKNQLETYFQDSSGRLFSRTTFDVRVSIDEAKEALQRLVAEKTLWFGQDEYVNVHYKNDTLLLTKKARTEHVERATFDSDLDIALNVIYRFGLTLYSLPFLLPAERNAFIITYKMLANRRYKLLKETQRGLFSSSRGNNRNRQLEILKEQGDIRYPQPVEDFLDFLTDVELRQGTKSSPQNAKNEFQKLADQVERQIQGNNKTNLKSTSLGGKEIKIDVNRGLSIDLYNASSSIKQLASLLLYLRYRAAENDLLIIDEPEMNLHPESQAKLLEVLTTLVNLGVKVLLTTHSPYFMAHLNNLVSNNIKSKHVLQEQASVLYLKNTQAFLSAEKVSAYEMRDNELHSLKDTDYGIQWDTLSDVSAVLQQKFFEIDEKGKAAPRATKKQPTKRSTKKKQQ